MTSYRGKYHQQTSSSNSYFFKKSIQKKTFTKDLKKSLKNRITQILIFVIENQTKSPPNIKKIKSK